MRLSICTAMAALLLLPAAAQADQITFGSSLAGTPDSTETHQADTLFFNHTAKNSTAAPASGEILAIRVKGRIVPKGAGKQDNNMWHSQVLRPNADNTFTVDSSSQHFYFPVGGSADEVHTFVPSTQCLKKGEYVDFNDIGGWDGDMSDPRGTQYQIFKSDTTSETWWYEHDQGTNIGANFLPNRRVRSDTGQVSPGAPYPKELMMQIVVGTGFDSSNLCEGGLKGYEYSGVDISKTTFNVYDDGVAGARIGCTSGRGFCEGTARLEVDGAEIGRANFNIARNVTTNLDIPLSNDGARVVNTKGLVDANVIVESHDDIGQQKTTTGIATLKSARPTPGGFAGTVVRPQSAGAKNGIAQLKATCPRGTEGACTGSIALVTQKRVFGRGFGGRRGSLPKVAAGAYTIPAGGTIRVPVKLSAKGKKLLTAAKSVVTVATVNSADGAGRPVSKRVKIVLKRR
jgi:hypothetical protein